MKKFKSTILCFLIMGALLLAGCGKGTETETGSEVKEEKTTSASAENSEGEPLAYGAVPALDPESAAGFVSEEELLAYFALVDEYGEAEMGPQELPALFVSQEGQGSQVVTVGDIQYVLSGRDMTVLRLNWSDSEILSTTTVGMDWSTVTSEDGLSWTGGEKIPAKLYAYDGHVAVISDRYGYSGEDGESGNASLAYKEYTSVDLYDVSDPAAPVLEASLGQSGYFQDAQVYDGTLTVVTCFEVTDEALYPAGYNYDEAIELPLSKIAGVTHPYAKTIEVIGSYALDEEEWDLFGVAGTDVCGSLSEGTLVFSACRTAEAVSRTYEKDNESYTETAYVGVTDLLVITSADGTAEYSMESTLPAKALVGAQFARTENGWAVVAETDARRESVSASGKHITEDEFTGWNVLLLDKSFAFESGVPIYEDRAPAWCSLGSSCVILGNDAGKITYTSFDGTVSVSLEGQNVADGYVVETAEDVYLLGREGNTSYLYRFNEKGEIGDVVKLGEDYASLFENRCGWFFDKSASRLGLAADDSYVIYLLSEDKLIIETDLYSGDWGWNNHLIALEGAYYLSDTKEVYAFSADDLSELIHLEF